MKRHLNIALVAHDSRKKELLEWVKYNACKLCEHSMYATGTTARLIKEQFKKEDDPANYVGGEAEMNRYWDWKVTALKSGPLGGDAEIAAMIAEKKIDVLIFFCDNLIIQGHNSDVQGLSRLASLYNIAFATNRTSADMIITSPLLDDDSYEMTIPDCIAKYTNRSL